MFKVGQKVWHFGFGWGVVTSINNSVIYPIKVHFNAKVDGAVFTCEGKWCTDQARTLFFKEVVAPADALTPPFVPTFKAGDVIKGSTKHGEFFFKVRSEQENFVVVEQPHDRTLNLFKDVYTFSKVGEDHS